MLSCYSGGALNPAAAQIKKPEVEQQVVGELCSFLNLRKQPKLLQSVYLPQAIPNYPVNHFRLQENIRLFHQETNSVRLAGNWIDGIGVSHRIAEAKILAEEISAEVDAIESRALG